MYKLLKSTQKQNEGERHSLETFLFQDLVAATGRAYHHSAAVPIKLDFEHKLGLFAAAVVTYSLFIALVGFQYLQMALFEQIVHAYNKERMMLPLERGPQG